MRELNQASIDLIKQWEAFIPFAYDDFDPPNKRRQIKAGDKINGTLTIGYGHTGADVKPGMTITKAHAEHLLRQDLREAQRAVDKFVKVPLSDNQYGVLVSFTFNCGAGNLQKSTLLRELNKGNYSRVPSELMKWVNSKGKKKQGLVNRRAAEAGLWSKGEFVQSSGSPVAAEKPPLVDSNIGGVVGVVTSTGLLQYLPSSGPVAYVLAAILAISAAVLLFNYIKSRRAV